MQPAVPINPLAILACVIVAVALGSVWYGPLFGKSWMKMSGIEMPKKMTPAVKKMMMKSYGIQLIGSILMAFVMAHSMVFAMTYLGITGISAGLQGGFWNWLGFVAPVTLGAVIWEGKPWKLWFINAGYYLVLLSVMGIIIAMM